jgi:hypothetical protein
MLAHCITGMLAASLKSVTVLVTIENVPPRWRPREIHVIPGPGPVGRIA